LRTALWVAGKIWARISYGLWIVNWIKAKQQLWLITFPTLWAHKDVYVLRLDDKFFENLSLIAKPAAITFADCVAVTGETIAHFRTYFLFADYPSTVLLVGSMVHEVLRLFYRSMGFCGLRAKKIQTSLFLARQVHMPEKSSTSHLM